MANEINALVDNLSVVVDEQWSKTCVMPMLCSQDYNDSMSSGGQGSIITMLDIKETEAPNTLIPGYYPNAANISDVVQVTRPLSLDYYKEKNFQLTSKDLDDLKALVVPKTVARNVNALVEDFDRYIYGKVMEYAYQSVGTVGGDPFASGISILSDAAGLLDDASTPNEDRYFVVDVFNNNKATGLSAFQDADKAGPAHTLLTNQIAFAVNYGWYKSNNVPTHTPGGGTVAIDAAGAAGDTTIVTDDGAGAVSDLIAGDQIVIAGDTQTYSIVSVVNGATEQTATIFPALVQTTIADADAVTVTAAHKLSFVFQRDAVQCVSREFENFEQLRRMGAPVQRIAHKSGMVISVQYNGYHALGNWHISLLAGAAVEPLKEGGIVRILT